jgi:hypothetical protein
MLDNNVQFIFNGEALDLEKTIEHYDIHDGDGIVAIEISDRPSRLEQRWMQISLDQTGFQEMIADYSTPGTRNELLRLRDLARMRRDMKFRRRQQPYIIKPFPWRTQRSIPETIIPERPSEIPSASLHGLC